MTKDFQAILAEVVGDLRSRLAVHAADAANEEDHASRRFYEGYVTACDAVLNVFDFAVKCRDAKPAIEVLENEMCRLVQVWEGTSTAEVSAHEVLEDVCNTLGHAHGLTSPELRDLWARVQARVYGSDRDELGCAFERTRDLYAEG